MAMTGMDLSVKYKTQQDIPHNSAALKPVDKEKVKLRTETEGIKSKVPEKTKVYFRHFNKICTEKLLVFLLMAIFS